MGASPRLERLVTAAPLGAPSLPLIAERDPARVHSETNVELYSDVSNDATTTHFLSRDGSTPVADCDGEASFRAVALHPNDHMPPKQKEYAQALAEFAERWSPRQRG